MSDQYLILPSLVEKFTGLVPLVFAGFQKIQRMGKQILVSNKKTNQNVYLKTEIVKNLTE